jgi:hypothetical protein
LKAADLQETEAAESFSYQCFLKAADLTVISDETKYTEAIQVGNRMFNIIAEIRESSH